MILFSAVPELKVFFTPQVWYVCPEPVQPSTQFRRGSNGTGLGLLLARTIQVIPAMGVVIPNEKDRAAIELGLTWSWKSFRFYYYFRSDVIMSPTGGGHSHCSLFWSSALMAEMLWACFYHPHGFLSVL